MLLKKLTTKSHSKQQRYEIVFYDSLNKREFAEKQINLLKLQLSKYDDHAKFNEVIWKANQQRNTWDCALYLVNFVEQFFQIDQEAVSRIIIDPKQIEDDARNLWIEHLVKNSMMH